MEKLSGGTVYRYDPNRPAIAPNADTPFFKGWLPGNLWLSSGACSLLEWTAAANKLGPRPTHGEVFIRRLDDGTRYIGVAVKVLDPSRKVEFQWEADQQAIAIRGLEQVYADAELDMDQDVVYRMECKRVEDEEYGICIAAAWTKAQAIPLKGSSGAAGQVTGPAASQDAAPGSQSGQGDGYSQ